MYTNIMPNSFVAVSDFHAIEWPLQKVKNHYLKEYDKIFILGDVTDRGENGQGTNGIKLLQEIKKLSEQYPGRVIYVPGNHDSFVYDYGVSQDYQAEECMRINHGKDTIRDIDRMRYNNPEELEDLLNWLGNLPLQVKHEFNGQNYVLAHAFFNDLIYALNPNFNLKTLGSMRNKLAHDLGNQIMWFRKQNDRYQPEYVPHNVIEVIGHTPEFYRGKENLDLQNNYGETIKVICVDGGIAYNGDMLKYDGGKEEVRTVSGYHQDTSPQMIGDANLTKIINATSQTAYNTVLKAIKESTSKYGIDQPREILEQAAKDNEDWYCYVSSENRNQMAELGSISIRRMLNSITQPQDELSDSINRFLITIYNNDAEFESMVNYQAMVENLSIEELLVPTKASGSQDTPTTPKVLTKREPQIYGLKKQNIIQDDLRP